MSARGLVRVKKNLLWQCALAWPFGEQPHFGQANQSGDNTPTLAWPIRVDNTPLWPGQSKWTTPMGYEVWGFKVDGAMGCGMWGLGLEGQWDVGCGG